MKLEIAFGYFSGERHTVMRAYDCLAYECSQVKLSSPGRITSTNLRKYMATVTQVCEMFVLQNDYF